MAETTNALSVAIVGAGPAGFYALDALLKAKIGLEVDLFDRSPFPYGLVRTGVAPDHQKIKSVEKVFAKLLDNPAVRYFGNVLLDQDVLLEELQDYYHFIILSYGAQSDRGLGIPGEESQYCLSAREFVGWYNSDPYINLPAYQISSFKDFGIVGIGNVAIDVARILVQDRALLKTTDISPLALSELENMCPQKIHFIIRRGPAQAACTPRELKELAQIAGVKIELTPESLELCNTAVRDARDSEVPALLLQLAEREIDHIKTRIIFHFARSPIFIEGGVNKLGKIILAKNELIEENGSISCKQIEGHDLTLELDLLFRSVGYKSLAISGCPFDNERGLVPNNAGQVVDESGRAIKGLFVAGWLKRGPSGLIGTNKADAAETVQKLLSVMPESANNPIKQDITELLRTRNIAYVSKENWYFLEQAELEQGKKHGSVRRKFPNAQSALQYLQDENRIDAKTN